MSHPTVGPKRYQRIFWRFMDEYAARNNLRGEHKLTAPELETMVAATHERIRKGYHLSDADHQSFKDMMAIILYGPDKGSEKVETASATP